MLHLSATLFSRKERQLCIAQTVEKNFRLNVNSAPGAVPRLPDPKIIPALRKILRLRDGLTRISNFRICHSRISSPGIITSNFRTATRNTPIHRFRTAIRNTPIHRFKTIIRNTPIHRFKTAIKHIRIQHVELHLVLLSQMPRHMEPATLPVKLYILPDGQNAPRSFLCSLLAYSRFWLCSMSCS